MDIFAEARWNIKSAAQRLILRGDSSPLGSTRIIITMKLLRYCLCVN